MPALRPICTSVSNRSPVMRQRFGGSRNRLQHGVQSCSRWFADDGFALVLVQASIAAMMAAASGWPPPGTGQYRSPLVAKRRAPWRMASKAICSLRIGKGPIERGDHRVDLVEVVRELEAGVAQIVVERLLADDKESARSAQCRLRKSTITIDDVIMSFRRRGQTQFAQFAANTPGACAWDCWTRKTVRLPCARIVVMARCALGSRASPKYTVPSRSKT